MLGSVWWICELCVHNTCGDGFITLYHGTSSNRAAKIVGNTFYPQQGFKGGVAFLAEEAATAKHFAFEQIAKTFPNAPTALSVIEFRVPLSAARKLGIGRGDRGVIGALNNLPFPDISGGSGFERILLDGSVKQFNALLKSGAITSRRLRIH